MGLEVGSSAAPRDATQQGAVLPGRPAGKGSITKTVFEPVSTRWRLSPAAAFTLRAGAHLLFTAAAFSTGNSWAWGCTISPSCPVRRATAVFVQRRASIVYAQHRPSSIAHVRQRAAAAAPAGVRERTGAADTFSFWTTWSTTTAPPPPSTTCARAAQHGAASAFNPGPHFPPLRAVAESAGWECTSQPELGASPAGVTVALARPV